MQESLKEKSAQVRAPRKCHPDRDTGAIAVRCRHTDLLRCM